MVWMLQAEASLNPKTFTVGPQARISGSCAKNITIFYADDFIDIYKGV